MKKQALIILASSLLILCACQKQPAQTPPEQTPTQIELPAAPAQDARPQTRTEMVDYLQSHTTLGGSLPAFCKAAKDGAAEKFQKGTARLAQAKTRFPVYLFEAMDSLPEEAFAGDAIWTLSDTPRGNLLLEGPEVCLVYNADEDDVHPPRKAEVDKDTLATLQTRYGQASFTPGFDRDGIATAAFLAYLKGNPAVFQDDGVSVFEDTAWLICCGDDGARSSAFCAKIHSAG